MKATSFFLILILMSVGVWAQNDSPNRDISVKVIDKKGRPVSNVVVHSPGTGKVGVTDRMGLFVFEDLSDDATIAMTLPKYGDVSFPITGMDSLVVKMNSTTRFAYVNNEGKAVIVKKTNTSSNVTLDVQALVEQYSYSTLSQLLAGRVPGLNNGASNIRGNSSFGASGTAPLIVVNGSPVTMSLDQIGDVYGMRNIKTIEVQKHASEWGSRGANGAILVTTR